MLQVQFQCRYRTTWRERWRTNWQHDYNADVCKRAVNHDFFNQRKFHRWTAKTTDNGASVWWIPHSIIIFVLEDNIQNTGEFLFRFFLGKLCFGSNRCTLRWTNEQTMYCCKFCLVFDVDFFSDFGSTCFFFAFYVEVVVFFEFRFLVFGFCEHCTKPSHTFPHTWFFLVWLKTWVIESTGIVVSRKTVVLTSSTACRTRPRCFFFHTLEHNLIFHMHSSPTIYQTFIDVYFTWIFTLRGSIECVFRPPGWNVLACRLSAERSQRGHLFFGQTNVLTQTEYDVDLAICYLGQCYLGQCYLGQLF